MSAPKVTGRFHQDGGLADGPSVFTPAPEHAEHAALVLTGHAIDAPHGVSDLLDVLAMVLGEPALWALEERRLGPDLTPPST